MSLKKKFKPVQDKKVGRVLICENKNVFACFLDLGHDARNNTMRYVLALYTYKEGTPRKDDVCIRQLQWDRILLKDAVDFRLYVNPEEKDAYTHWQNLKTYEIS